MEKFFGRFFEKKTVPEPKEDGSTIYPGLSGSSKRLLGLKEFIPKSNEETKKLLRSNERYRAYEQIETATNPSHHQTAYKKGIVRSMVERYPIAENILHDYTTLYIGSGDDIEYPLALGSRKIVLMDPILDNPEIIQKIKNRIEKLIARPLKLQNSDAFSFTFDFGQGPETVGVLLKKTPYTPETEIPDENIGLVLMFASQGPAGPLSLGDNLKEKIVLGGGILEQSTLVRKLEDKEEIIELDKI